MSFNLPGSFWFRDYTIPRAWRSRWHFPPKHQLTINGLHGVVTQKFCERQEYISLGMLRRIFWRIGTFFRKLLPSLSDWERRIRFLFDDGTHLQMHCVAAYKIKIQELSFMVSTFAVALNWRWRCCVKPRAVRIDSYGIAYSAAAILTSPYSTSPYVQSLTLPTTCAVRFPYFEKKFPHI
jgi:hypothetical protein